MQHNKHFETKNVKQLLYIFLVQLGWSPSITVCLRTSGVCNIINTLRHKILGKCCYILSGSARLKSWHHFMPERFWDMQHNKHFGTKRFKQMLYIFLIQPGWSPGITVCLGTSRICSIQFHCKIDDNFFVFFLKNYPPLFCPFIRNPPLKDKSLKGRFGIIVLFYFCKKSLFISGPPVKWSLFD